jgi:Anti-sigma-28 factor, FlgM
MIQANPMHRGQEGRTVIPFDDDVREELVSRVRREIEAGTYDTLDKFNAALDRLADRLERD